jgi:hypothetical protein
MISLLLFRELQNLNNHRDMNKRDFIKSVAAMTGATAVAPLAAAISPSKPTTVSSGLSSALVDDRAKKKSCFKKGPGIRNDQKGIVVNR